MQKIIFILYPHFTCINFIKTIKNKLKLNNILTKKILLKYELIPQLINKNIKKIEIQALNIANGIHNFYTINYHKHFCYTYYSVLYKNNKIIASSDYAYPLKSILNTISQNTVQLITYICIGYSYHPYIKKYTTRIKFHKINTNDFLNNNVFIEELLHNILIKTYIQFISGDIIDTNIYLPHFLLYNNNFY